MTQQHPELTDEDLQLLQQKLEEERQQLEEEMREVGRPEVFTPADWEPAATDIEVEPADKSEVADKIEEIVDHNAILSDLEVRHRKVLRALAKLKAGTYGFSEISGRPIERARLMADPAARTTIDERDQEDSLPL